MTEPSEALPVEEPVIRALLDRSAAKNWGRRSVLAVQAAPRWEGDREIRHADRNYLIWPCTSVLAVRNALRHRHSDPSPIILTNLGRDQLGTGICEHLVDHKPLPPDPTVALRDLFSAGRQESQLLRHRDSAVAVLRQLSGHRVPPAPGGVLTQALLLGTVVEHGFGLSDQAPTAADLLVFSADRRAADRFAYWRARSGEALAADVLQWLQGNLERAAAPIIAALRTGRMGELLPLGLVAGLLYPDGPDSTVVGSGSAELELKLELAHYLQLSDRHPDAVWTAFAQASLTAVTRLLARPDSNLVAVFDQADRLATGPLQATTLIERSDYLPTALLERVQRLARAGLAAAAIEPLTPVELEPVESLWVRVAEHHQAGTEHPPALLTVSQSAVRLLRYLVGQPSPIADVRSLPTRYLDHESWVDAAVNDAVGGSSDKDVADLVNQVSTQVRARRAEQDRRAATFLPALTHVTPTGPLYIEQILDRVVAPIAQNGPVLVLVLDGMSAAAAHDVVASVGGVPAAAWQEAELADDLRAAIAVFPTVTDRSRCSLLSAGLASGPDRIENENFGHWLRNNGFQGARPGPALFHKADLDAQSAGYDLPSAVRAAIDDTAGRGVVAAVLNTIDDALDRSDPLRTEWGISNVRHLGPLLAAAARVGRTVVLTSDHGHVVERRELGIDRRSPEKPARWRPVAGPPVGPDEVSLSGPRVLTDDHSVILAVDEQLRYGPLKAGYHGGGALAEVVVPVTILVSGEIAEGSPLRLAPPRAPEWWQQGSPVGANPAATEAVRPEPVRPRRRPAADPAAPGGLFDFPAIPDPMPEVWSGSTPDVRLVKLLRGKQFQANRDRFGGSLTSAQVGALFEALLRPGGSITVAAAAAALEVPVKRAPRVLAVVSQIVNIDGVPVLTQDSTQVVLVVDLLFEQFGVAR